MAALQNCHAHLTETVSFFSVNWAWQFCNAVMPFDENEQDIVLEGDIRYTPKKKYLDGQ